MGAAANTMLGSTFGKVVNVFIALQLIATISGYLWVGSRITQKMATENKLWSFLKKQNRHEIPVRAIFMHVIIAVLIILTGTFKEIFVYTAFILQILASLAVSTVFFLKKKDRTLFKSNIFYIFPTVFLAFSCYIIYFTFVTNPRESFVGLGIIGLGLIIYLLDKRIKGSVDETEDTQEF